MTEDRRWLDARWAADDGGPGAPWIAQVFANAFQAHEAFPDVFELAYIEGDAEPYVTRQVLPLGQALEDPTLLKAWVAYQEEQNELLMRETRGSPR